MRLLLFHVVSVGTSGSPRPVAVTLADEGKQFGKMHQKALCTLRHLVVFFVGLGRATGGTVAASQIALRRNLRAKCLWQMLDVLSALLFARYQLLRQPLLARRQVGFR